MWQKYFHKYSNLVLKHRLVIQIAKIIISHIEHSSQNEKFIQYYKQLSNARNKALSMYTVE